MISPIFTTIVITFGIIWIYMKITTNNIGKDTEKFMDREIRANKVRKQPLDSLEYITVPIEKIPRPDDYPNERICELTGILMELSTKTIVNLTGISNTDLKLTYGAPNLPLLTEYDQNFTTLCTTIYDLGCEYLAVGLKTTAVTVLNVGVDLGTDISKNYLTLAEIYAEEGNFSEIQRLITCADNIRSLTKNSTISKLIDILDENTSSVTQINKNPDSIDDSDNILPQDILDILETVPYISDDQK